MGFRIYNAAISLSAVSTHSFSAFVYHHSTLMKKQLYMEDKTFHLVVCISIFLGHYIP